MRNQAGLTLVELMVTLAIAGILVIGAIPSFVTMMDNSRGFDQANTFFNTLAFARGQAVNLGQRVTVCNLADGGVTCTDQWENGVTVFVDFNGNGVVDGANATQDQILRRTNALPDGDTLAINLVRATFNSEGIVTAGGNGSITICPSDDIEVARQIIIAPSGRVRVTHQNDDPLNTFTCS